MQYLVIYQKKDNSIIFRTRSTYPDFNIGDITSMGWLVLDIQYFINGRYFNEENFKKNLFLSSKKYRQKIFRENTKENIIDFLTKNHNIGGKK